MENIDTKKKSKNKYFIYLSIVITASTLAFLYSLWGQFTAVMLTIGSAKPSWVIVMILLTFACYFVEALIIKIFARLYTKKYSIKQGLATSLIGQFFSDVTPGASGGQVMQTYTLRNQGIPISSAASIFVMSLILYQFSLIGFDIVALIVERDVVASITTVRIGTKYVIPMWPLILFGFFINLSVTGAIYLLSYSKFFHNFVLNIIIPFLGKIKIIKEPDKTRENLRVSVENYKIELRRLHSNIPVAVTIILLDLVLLFVRNSIPYFSGLALEAYSSTKFSFSKMVDASFLCAFNQMVTGLIPLPGGAGVSEYFFEILFYNFFDATIVEGQVIRSRLVNVSSAQILWRLITFHLMFVISGIFVAIYPNKPKEEFSSVTRKTFVTLQISTLSERRMTSDSMYETAKLSRKEIAKKLNPLTLKERLKASKEERIKLKEEKKTLQNSMKEKESANNDWESINIDI